jgi:hypothetical protein
MTGDDSLCFAAVVTDEYGRDTVFSDVPCVLSDSGLIWPDAVDLSDHDPSNWAY